MQGASDVTLLAASEKPAHQGRPHLTGGGPCAGAELEHQRLTGLAAEIGIGAMRGPRRVNGEASNREGNSDRGDIVRKVGGGRGTGPRPNVTLAGDVAVGTRNEHQGAGVFGMFIERYPKMDGSLRRA